MTGTIRAQSCAFAANCTADFLRAAWSEALGAPDPSGASYYGALRAVLERLLAADGGSTAETLGCRVEEWRRAYLRTPHRQPVEPAAGSTAHR